MIWPTRRRHPIGALTAIGLAAALTAGCGGSGGDGAEVSPQAAMEKAKQLFDDSASVQLEMTSDAEPDGGSAVLGAEGTLTHQPAFEGEVSALISGFKADVPLVSVDGAVYAKLPLTPAFAEIDPAEYGAPDPAEFADPDSGISGLLLQLEGLAADGQIRQGGAVLTTYAGELSGELVAAIIPSAATEETFETVVGIDDGGQLASLAVTGDFFADGGEATYDIAFDGYGENATVTAP